MTEQTKASDALSTSLLEKSAKSSRFKTIQEIAVPDKSDKPTFIRPTPEQVAAWIVEHPGAVAGQTLTLKLAKGESSKMPCLAVARGPEFILVLNVDGKTHKLALDEVA
jgi:hypothetical protein